MNIPYLPNSPTPKWHWIILAIIILILLMVGVVRAEEPNWDTLIPIVIQIESNGNPTAISQDGCIGLMQVNPVVLKEWNNEHLFFEYELSALFKIEQNIEIGTWYLKQIWFHYLPYYHIPQTIENLLIAYNWGISNLNNWYKKYISKHTLYQYQLTKYQQEKFSQWYIERDNNHLPKETRNYIKKYKRLAEKEK